jgi:FkbM family methyltransferase
VNQYLRKLESLLSEPVASVLEKERTAFDCELAKSEGRLVLVGAGNLGRRALSCLRSAGITPLAFTDNGRDLWGTEVDNVPILSPEVAAERFGRSALFVVTIWSPGHRYADTRQRLLGLGCRNVICATRLRWKFADQLLPDYCQDLPHKVYEQASSVLEAASLMADDFSREQYLHQVRWRALGDFGELSPPQPHQYFPDGLFRLLPREVFIDCGAYDGITIRRFLKRSREFLRIYAIDADPSNYKQLVRTISALPDRDRIESHYLAVGAKHDRVRFQSTGTVQAAVSSNGDIEVEQVPLDDLLKGAEPTFIKMDIEGAELGALEGARHLIRQSQPLLAVCVYHTPSDLWRIPLKIHELAPRHALYLRPHVEDGWDLVCYAIPPERVSAMAVSATTSS